MHYRYRDQNYSKELYKKKRMTQNFLKIKIEGWNWIVEKAFCVKVSTILRCRILLISMDSNKMPFLKVVRGQTHYWMGHANVRSQFWRF